jgi:hypothetical protein
MVKVRYVNDKGAKEMIKRSQRNDKEKQMDTGY